MPAGVEPDRAKVMGDLRIKVRDEAGTAALAARLASVLTSGDVVTLEGGLGAGKSAFARALIRSLCGGETDVPSPTFTLVQTYEAPDFDIWHFDLYRLEDPEEVLELGLEDAFADGVSLIEWPDRLGPYMPRDRLSVRIDVSGDNDGTERDFTLTGTDGWSARIDGLATDD